MSVVMRMMVTPWLRLISGSQWRSVEWISVATLSVIKNVLIVLIVWRPLSSAQRGTTNYHGEVKIKKNGKIGNIYLFTKMPLREVIRRFLNSPKYWIRSSLDKILRACGYISKIEFIWKTVIKNVLNLVFSPIKIIESDILQSFDMCDIARTL